jgi:hypothetical protein
MDILIELCISDPGTPLQDFQSLTSCLNLVGWFAVALGRVAMGGTAQCFAYSYPRADLLVSLGFLADSRAFVQNVTVINEQQDSPDGKQSEDPAVNQGPGPRPSEPKPGKICPGWINVFQPRDAQTRQADKVDFFVIN